MPVPLGIRLVARLAQVIRAEKSQTGSDHVKVISVYQKTNDFLIHFRFKH